MVQFPCAACGRELKVKENLRGKKVKCPRCDAITRVPAESAAVSPPEPAVAPTKAASPPPSLPAQPPSTPARRPIPWQWVGAGVLVLAALGGMLLYLFATDGSTPPGPNAVAVAPPPDIPTPDVPAPGKSDTPSPAEQPDEDGKNDEPETEKVESAEQLARRLETLRSVESKVFPVLLEKFPHPEQKDVVLLNAVKPLAFSPDGQLLAYGVPGPSPFVSKATAVLELAAGTVRHELPTEEGGLPARTFTPDSTRLVEAGTGLARTIDAVRGQLVQEVKVEGLGLALDAPVLSPDGQFLAGNRRPPGLAVVHLVDGKLRTLDRARGTTQFRATTYSPTGQRIATCTQLDGKLRVYVVSASSGRRLGEYRPTEEVRSLTFTPDGKSLLMVDQKELTLWNLETKSTQPLAAPLNAPTRAVYSPDGQWLALSDQRTVFLCEAASGKPLWSTFASEATFSRGGSLLATWVDDGRVELRYLPHLVGKAK